jgi:uncharacterized repeat protein (TIGR01451 family)
VEVTTQHGPATGNNHLVLDDSVSDAVYSVAEAVLRLNLAGKKNVVLTFKAKSLGNDPHVPPSGNTTLRTYDGVAISTNGGATWRVVQSLSDLDGTWQSFSVSLDAAAAATGGTFNSDFRIRFSEYDNSSAPIDGIAIDDVAVTADDDQRIVLELPGSVTEGSGPHTAYVMLSLPPTEALTVNLSASPVGLLLAPASVVIPAGELFASFEFSVADDNLINLTRTATITPSAPNATGSAASIKIVDNELKPTATLTLPATVTEGAAPTNNATISLNTPADVPLTFSLASNPTSEVSTPATVTIPAGQSQTVFTIQAVNDTVLDGAIVVTVSATAPGLAVATAQTTAADNEVPALSLTLPASIVEGNAGSATVTMSGALQSPVDINLTSSAPATASAPAKVTIPAGQTTATFAITAANDTLVNFNRSITITASGTGVTGTSNFTVVTDDEPPPVISLSVPPQLTEGDSPTNNATITLSGPAAVAITVTLSVAPVSELTLPFSVTIPAGQTQALFTARATNDSRIDGNILTTITATASGLVPASAQTTAIDNETRTISLSAPATVQEGSTATVTVSIPGTLTTDLQIALLSDKPSSLTLPANVTITAGSTSANVTATAVDNALQDGTRTVVISGQAPSFTDGNRSITLRDNDVASYRFSALTDIVNVSSPVSLTVSAADIEGNSMNGYSGTASLSVVLPDGTTQPVTPATVTLSGASGWTGNVTLPVVSATPLRLRASDTNGVSGDSTSFDVMRVLSLPTADLLWDAQRGRILASVPAAAASPYANKVVAIDPGTMAVTGSVTTNQDPGQLVMTSGGEYLYVALNTNGSIAKINAASMTLVSTFPVGVDPFYGTLYASDMCTVAGQPNVLIVSQYRKSASPSHNGVAAYDNGVIRPLKTQDHTGSNIIEPSADPTIFFGYNTESTEYGFRRLQLGSNGMTELAVNGTLFSGFSIDMRSAGNNVYSTTGVAVDGALMKRTGTFSANGLVCPSPANGRVFFLEPQSSYSTTFDKLSAHDPGTFTPVRRLSLPAVTSPSSLIRWGTNGLAFRTATSVSFVGSSNLVPTEPPADLSTTVAATPNPATTGENLTYTITATNQGPDIARNVLVTANLSDSQTIQSATGSTGPAVQITGNLVNWSPGDLAVGSSATLTVTATPQSAGGLTCTGSTVSNSTDPNFANNIGFKLVSVGFQTTVDVVNQLRVPANNLAFDATRNLLWASIPSTVDAPLGRSVVSIDPQTGLISNPIAINANPMAQSMALSANGRYLYVGLTDVPEVHRIDLTATPPTSARIPLGLSQWGSANHAQDIEPLDGDGTSFMMSGSDDHAAAIYDGVIRRTNRTGIYTIDRIERTATPGAFIGYNNYSSGFDLSRLSISSSGVTAGPTVGNVITGYYVDIRTSGNVLVSSNGKVVDCATLTLKTDLAVSGRPAVDESYKRAFLVNGNALRAYSTDTGTAKGTLPLPTASTGDWAATNVRWGLDGFAILGNDGKIYVTRWSATIPAEMDANADNISDAWSVQYFGSLSVNKTGDADGDGIPDVLEYLFGTSPTAATKTPFQSWTETQSGQTVLHVVYPRRTGLSAFCRYEKSVDLAAWQQSTYVNETIVGTQTIGSESFETVDAAIPFVGGDSGFVRVKWLEP